MVKQRRLVRSALALAAAATLAASLTACVGGSNDSERAQQGPNGFDLIHNFEGGYSAWYDRSDESGLTDIIMMNGHRRVMSCLGKAPQLCNDNRFEDGQTVLFIAPPGTVRVEVDYSGQPLELVGLEGVDPELDQPFALVAPPIEREGFSWSFRGFDADGNETFSQ